MSDKRSTFMSDPGTAYLFVGITFFAVAIVFMFTDMGIMWIAMFTLGITFVIIGTTQRKKPAKGEDEIPKPVDPPQ